MIVIQATPCLSLPLLLQPPKRSSAYFPALGQPILFNTITGLILLKFSLVPSLSCLNQLSDFILPLVSHLGSGTRFIKSPVSFSSFFTQIYPAPSHYVPTMLNFFHYPKMLCSLTSSGEHSLFPCSEYFSFPTTLPTLSTQCAPAESLSRNYL